MKKLLPLLLALCLTLSACAAPAAVPQSVTVSSRSSKFDLFRYRNGFYNIKN